MDQYATISGAWSLEARCHHLTVEERQEFEWQLAQLTQVALRQLGPAWLFRLQRGGAQAAAARTCSPETSEIVSEALRRSRILSLETRGAVWTPEKGAEFSRKRLFLIAGAVGLEEACKFGPVERRGRFISLYEAIAKKLQVDQADPRLFESAEAVRTVTRNAPASDCTAKAKNMILHYEREARALGVMLDVFPDGAAKDAG